MTSFIVGNATSRDADRAPRFAQPGGGRIARLVEAVGARLQTALARRAAAGELVAMSDCELADIGISRSEVDRLFDPEFAHEYESR